MTAILIISGLALLFWGGENLVNGSVAIARKLDISPLLIGLVLVGFGTSTPELITCILAALDNKPGIAIGNVVGSNIANIFLILGSTALLVPLACDKTAFKKDGVFMVLATLAFLAVAFTGFISRPVGILFLAVLGGYIGYSVWLEKKGKVKTSDIGVPALEPEENGIAEVTVSEGFKNSFFYSTLQFVIGLFFVFLGARFLVDGSTTLAQSMGVSDTVIGLTIVAIGTSLPELVASLMAAFKKQGDMAYGNIIGSNIYNILSILGVTAVIHPIAIPPEILQLDIWVLLAATLGLMVVSATSWKIVRREGAFFLGAYIVYMGYLAYTSINQV
ncbi:MAG: sodium:calcium antiporter [Alphaproteobacteria bacterium]|nr:sodium:calcium antiporter [Alphaproteobacteria bacterium]|tara:strand:+ start:70 stop:1065 length:996 start_codon:yes stop_codon:yes gene_type:complete